MHKFRTLAVAALAMMALVAFAVGGASACDGKAKASTADAKTASADMKVAGSGCSSSAAKTASADMKVAGAGCSASATTADAKVAGAAACSSMKTAGAGCTKAMEASRSKVAMEAVRMPSGALAVFYNGLDAETTEMLHAKAESQGANFGCGIAGAIASNEDCNVEVASTEHGIMLLVTSEKAEVLDEYQETYAVAMHQHGEEADSE